MQNNTFMLRVSSVLNRDVKQFGKHFMTDGNEDTCWNSDQGLPQWVEVYFRESTAISSFSIQFQGGFVGQDCVLTVNDIVNNETSYHKFYPQDINTVQKFDIGRLVHASSVRFLFNKSTDFFGRIVIYKLIL